MSELYKVELVEAALLILENISLKITLSLLKKL